MISVIMAYHERAFQFMNTLDSYLRWYEPSMIEICMVEDMPVKNDPLGERILKKYPFKYQYTLVDRRKQTWRNPAKLYNLAAEMASRSVLGITNPENLHTGAVFEHSLSVINETNYIVYACANTSFIPRSLDECLGRWGTPGSYLPVGPSGHCWYTHSTINKRPLHFMSVITGENYRRIGGFDEEYENGYCYEDDDFAERVTNGGLTIEHIDSPCVVHQFHSRSQHVAHHDGVSGLDRNRELFMKKWPNSRALLG